MEVEVTNREIIKPSSPTPDHLRRMEPSFYDEMQRRVLIPTLYFYPKDPIITDPERSKELKQSLSHILTKFYPLAGRVQEDYTNCNDEGVPYFEAQANCQLSEVVGESCLSKLNKLLPFSDRKESHVLPFAVQLNFFKCGGIAIGLSTNHKNFDAASIFYFVNCWAACTRGDHAQVTNPNFDLPKLFPPARLENYSTTPTPFDSSKFVARRFLFSASSLNVLKAEFPTKTSRVMALSSFIWRTIVQGAGPDRRFLAFLMMNLRTRAEPPLSDNYFGNLVGFAFVGTSDDAALIDGPDFVSQTKEAVQRNAESFLQKFKNYDAPVEVDDYSTKPEDVNVKFSSFAHFPVYEADFGWGRPGWVTMGGSCFINTALYLPTKSGEGLEVLLYLDREDMNRLENDRSFIEIASLDATSNM
ncbi:Vinorine synthase [Bertholletia excelsa]